MDLLSALKRKKAPPPDAADSVRTARTRARRRLIGAAVLVVAGIIGFPLLFETQPRPIPVDLPIDMPRPDAATALVLPAPPAPQPKSASAPGPKPSHGAEGAVIEESAADVGRELAPAPRPAAVASGTGQAVEPPSAVARSPERTSAGTTPKAQTLPGSPPPAPAAVPTKQAGASVDDGARAKSLLEGKPAPSSESSSQAAAGGQRFVVQVGAFTDAAAVKATRSKVEKLGLVTYTQVAETPSGARTRVRVGPFATRAEAERAAARIKAADLPTVILAL